MLSLGPPEPVESLASRHESPIDGDSESHPQNFYHAGNYVEGGFGVVKGYSSLELLSGGGFEPVGAYQKDSGGWKFAELVHDNAHDSISRMRGRSGLQ